MYTETNMTTVTLCSTPNGRLHAKHCADYYTANAVAFKTDVFAEQVQLQQPQQHCCSYNMNATAVARAATAEATGMAAVLSAPLEALLDELVLLHLSLAVDVLLIWTTLVLPAQHAWDLCQLNKNVSTNNSRRANREMAQNVV